MSNEITLDDLTFDDLETQTKVSPLEAPTAPKPKKEPIRNGTWVDGVPVADVSAKVFKEWIEKRIPNLEVKLSDVNRTVDKNQIINTYIQLHKKLTILGAISTQPNVVTEE